MDVLVFVSEIVKSLAWPTVALVALLTLKKELKSLVPFVKKLKAGPVEAEFERDINQLKKMVSPNESGQSLSPAATASKEFLFQLADLHPRSAILESWVRLEAAARTALSRSSAAPTKTYVSAVGLAQALSSEGVLSQKQVTLYHELRRLRNDAAHLVDAEPTLDSVHSYIELAAVLQGYFETVQT